MTEQTPVETTTISYDLTALSMSALRLSQRILKESADQSSVARTCSNLREFASWLEDEADDWR